MTIKSAIQSIRVWGLKGAIAYAKRWPTLHRLRTSDRKATKRPQKGITLIGPFSSHSGNSQTMRNFARMLDLVGIPFQTFDMNDHPTIPKKDYVSIVTPRCDFDLGRYDHVIEMFSSHAPKSPNRTHSLMMFWEFESGLQFAFPDVASGMPILAMSDFNARYIRTILPESVPVLKIRHPLMLSDIEVAETSKIRQKYRIPHDAFMVFFNFDYGSSYFRKNPEAVLMAFAKAFPTRENAVLVLKTSNAAKNPATSQRLHNLACQLSLDSTHLVLVDGPIPQVDMWGLFNACDTYISLHRGEGFGIGMAEAMSFAKPVIATGYSANTEFCRPDTSIPIPYRLVPPKPEEIDLNVYSRVDKWAEPDVDVAAEALTRCYIDPQFRASIGTAGYSFIREYFSPANFKRDVEAFLESNYSPASYLQ